MDNFIFYAVLRNKYLSREESIYCKKANLII